MGSTESEREALVVLGMPEAHWLGPIDYAHLAALRRHWNLVGAPDGASSAAGRRTEKVSLLEGLYRGLDRRLFGRGRWQLAGSAGAVLSSDAAGELASWQLAWRRDTQVALGLDALCVEYEGLPMAELDRAIRQRLGHPGGSLCVRVWLLQAVQPPRLLMTGRLRLEHRSLQRSIVFCATKLPAMLKAALARRHKTTEAQAPRDPAVPAALPAAWQLSRLAREMLKWPLWRDQWQIEVGRFVGSEPGPGETTAVIRPPDSSFWADPFLLRREGQTWVLFEELPFNTNKGHICAIEIDGVGKPVSAPQVVLQEPWHLSYPFLWHEEGRVYMIPEAGASRNLTLYEAVGATMQWARRATLLPDVRLADATVVRHEGRLWMFATSADDGATSMEDCLHVYWAATIEGPWHSHALNPVKVDAGSSRPAGAMWVANGVLHRVVQDCASTYGGSTHCMRVTRLTEDEFAEEPVAGWAPQQAGTNDPWHTFNAIGNMTVVDRLVRLPRWRTR